MARIDKQSPTMALSQDDCSPSLLHDRSTTDARSTSTITQQKTGVITPIQLHFYGTKEAAALDGVTIIYGRHLQITSAIYSSGAL